MDGSITLENLTVAYDREPAVHHLSGRFEPGSMTAIVGPNGAGKSTLLRSIVGILKPDEGNIRLGVPSRRQLAYLPQQAEIDRGFPIGIADTVALGLWGETGAFGGFSSGQRQRVSQALETVGLDVPGDRPVGMLSAGQFQRVLFARLLVQDAPILLLDEPFSAVDERTTADLLAVLHRWHRERRTIVAVLHDVEQVRGHFPMALVLARELVAWGETRDVLTAPNLARARALAAARHHPHANVHA